jgi:hypothetical protein
MFHLNKFGQRKPIFWSNQIHWARPVSFLPRLARDHPPRPTHHRSLPYRTSPTSCRECIMSHCSRRLMPLPRAHLYHEQQCASSPMSHHLPVHPPHRTRPPARALSLFVPMRRAAAPTSSLWPNSFCKPHSHELKPGTTGVLALPGECCCPIPPPSPLQCRDCPLASPFSLPHEME